MSDQTKRGKNKHVSNSKYDRRKIEESRIGNMMNIALVETDVRPSFSPDYYSEAMLKLPAGLCLTVSKGGMRFVSKSAMVSKIKSLKKKGDHKPIGEVLGYLYPVADILSNEVLIVWNASWLFPEGSPSGAGYWYVKIYAERVPRDRACPKYLIERAALFQQAPTKKLGPATINYTVMRLLPFPNKDGR